MVFRGIIDVETRAYVKYLTKHEQISTREIIEKTGVSRATIHRIKKEKAGDKSVSQKRRRKGGRPTKLDARDERQLLRSLKVSGKKKNSSRQSAQWKRQEYKKVKQAIGQLDVALNDTVTISCKPEKRD